MQQFFMHFHLEETTGHGLLAYEIYIENSEILLPGSYLRRCYGSHVLLVGMSDFVRVMASWMLRCAICYNFTYVSEVLTASSPCSWGSKQC
jgi:hypothetical protein